MMQQKDNPLPEMLSILFGEGWCYFLTDDSLDSCEKKKTVNLVHFQSPSKAQLFSNSFSAFAMITFVIDTSLESFWNEEILITVCSLVGPKLSASETLVPVWKQRIIRSSISKLKELVEKICDERFDCNELKDEDIFKVEVDVKNEFPDEPTLQELPIKDLIKTNESSKAEENCPGSITDTQSQESDENNENLSSPFCPNEPGQDVDIAEEDASTEYNTDGNALAEDILETSPSGNAEKSGIESVRCAFCSNTFADKRKLRAHVRLQHRVPAAPHHPSSDNGLSQNQQPKTEQQPSFFKQPRKRIYKRCYTETPGGLECAECSQVLPTKMKLHLHRKKFHISTNVKCDQCNKIYTSGKFLARHKEKSHLSEPAREICDQCPRSFKNRKSLLSHKTIYHNSGRSVAEQRKSYPSHDATIPESERTCHLCGKISRHLASLKRHFLYGESWSLVIVTLDGGNPSALWCFD